MEHEDGYCDRCGAETVLEVWLTLDGRALCRACGVAEIGKPWTVLRPEARENG